MELRIPLHSLTNHQPLHVIVINLVQWFHHGSRIVTDRDIFRRKADRAG